MQIAMVGLGKMGANMVRRLMHGGHECVVFDRKQASVDDLASEGASGVRSLEDLATSLAPPRAVWVMVPAGGPTEEIVRALAGCLASRDIIIDGGNSYFKDDIRRGNQLSKQGISYVDVGTSGGRVGRRSRLLPDDRWCRGCRATPRSDLPHPCARTRPDRAHTGPGELSGGRLRRGTFIAGRAAPGIS